MELSNNISASNEGQFFLIAGPCVIESEEQVLKTARELKDITERHEIDLIFKSSFDKANRSSISSYRGPGMERGLEILQRVKDDYDLPVITDFHVPEQASPVSDVVDLLQVPAFLSRQTDMLTAAGETGLPIHVKKGQFLAADTMDNVINKIESTGNDRVMICERGTTFGYNNLVVDMRSLEIMRHLGAPVIFDCTHAVQRPGGKGKSSGGNREFVAPLARAACATGVDGLFMEVHPDPENALSDGSNSMPFSDVKELLKTAKEIHGIR